MTKCRSSRRLTLNRRDATQIVQDTSQASHTTLFTSVKRPPSHHTIISLPPVTQLYHETPDLTTTTMPSKTKPSKAPPPSDPLDDLAAEPPTEEIDPYAVLSVARDATDDQIKKAYRKAALKHHPGKLVPFLTSSTIYFARCPHFHTNTSTSTSADPLLSQTDKATGPHAATAHTDFQRIAFAYSILSTPFRRSHYDATGSTSTSHLDDDDSAFDWSTFFRSAYAEITLSSVASFRTTYKNSAEERADLLREFEAAKGNLDRVYECVMLSDVLEDDERFRGILDEAIAGGEVQGWERYVKESEESKAKRVKRAEKEARLAEKEKLKMEKKAKEKGKGKKGGADDGEAGLMALIQGRQKERGASFLDRLEAKYKDEEAGQKAGKKVGGGKKPTGPGSKKRKQVEEEEEEETGDAVDEPPEEAFAAMQERMEHGRKRRK